MRCAVPAAELPDGWHTTANCWAFGLVAACRRCNQRKENRLPHEIGLKLARRPFVPVDGFRLSLGRPEPEWEPFLSIP